MVMFDRRAYRLGFAPIVAALVVLAFSLEGRPPPFDPAPGTIEFDAEGAESAMRDVLRVGEVRTPGSEGSSAAADEVRESFELISRGTVAEQTFESEVRGDDESLRNVVLTLPSANDRAIVVIAGRDARGGPGIPSSAAATGVLLSLARSLEVSDRDRTMVFASIDGLSAGADGIRTMLDALPDRLDVEAVLEISQPGFAEPFAPHLLASSTSDRSPSAGLVATAEAILAERAAAYAGLDGPLGQIARLALPAASGAEAALNGSGLDAIAISSAGAVPLAPENASEDHFSVNTLNRFGEAVLALVGALDSAPAPALHGPDTYIRFGDNLIPSWVLGLLVLALLAPPTLAVVSELARSGRENGGAGAALRWASEWALVALAPLIALYALAMLGLIPRPESPFDPGSFELGPLEVIVIVLLLAGAGGTWWVLGLRRLPGSADAITLGAAAAAVVIVSCLLAWLTNPALALLMVPMAHVFAIYVVPGRATITALPVAGLALLPLLAAVLHVATSLAWGSSAPWQLVLLVSGGTLGLVPALAIGAALCGLAALVFSALAPSRPASR